MNMYLFDSDYIEGCIPEILDALTRTNFDQTHGYGTDRFCDEAKTRIKSACCAPDAQVYFLVGGTQTNATVISHILRPYQCVVCAESGHINVHETGAIEHTGHKVSALPAKDGKVSADAVDAFFKAHSIASSPEHEPQPAMVYISFPTELGTVYTRDELQALSKVCRKWNAPLFVDGARLGYGLASEGCDVTLRDLAELADVFYIGGTKQGALMGEAVVFCNPALAGNFRYSIKQNGGLLAKGRLLGIQFATLFGEDQLYLKYSRHAVAQAMRIKSAFAAKGISFFVDSPTNQQFPILENALIKKLRKDFSFEDWAKIDEAHTAVRFCTSWATRPDVVDSLIAAIDRG